MIGIVYSSDDDFAKKHNFANWAAYSAKKTFPIQSKLTDDRVEANARINEWIGSFNVDITDARFTSYLKGLEIEVICRMHDRDKHRKERTEAMIIMPHDCIYQAERSKLMSIGLALSYRKRGGCR